MGKKKHEDICVLRQASPKMTSAEEEVNKWIGWPVLWIPVISQLLLSFLSRLMNKVARVAGMEVVNSLCCVSR